MEYLPLDKGSHIPFYLQLTAQLIRMIEEGELKPGDKIASERELSETLRVSRITARLAIQELYKSGLIYRERGRGTFVAESKMRNVQGFTSFTENMKKRGMQPGSQILQQDVIPAEETLARQLHIYPGDPTLHLVRLRTADGKPLAIQYAHIPLKLCQGLEKEPMANQSLFAVLRTKYSVYPAWTEAIVEAGSALSEEARLLNIKQGEPVLVVRGITFSETFDIVESVRTIYPSRGFALYLGRQRI
ncbi:MAG: GntR family transcriptional regulator [Anaerolineales bacterium]|nr:GntR family transcriptional regulator [Anaerolineales bacterium]